MQCSSLVSTYAATELKWHLIKNPQGPTNFAPIINHVARFVVAVSSIIVSDRPLYRFAEKQKDVNQG